MAQAHRASLRLALAVLGVALVLAMLVAVLVGPTSISLGQVVAVLLDPSGTGLSADVPSSTRVIVGSLRMPRAALCALVGAALGAGGAASQGLFRNPLADPGTINGAVQTRTHGPAHELLTMSGVQVTNSPRTLTYDTKGNMTTDDRGCGMTWDFDNMLLSFAANGVTDLKNATYEYDAIGRRVAKNVAETGGTQTTVFVQAGQQVTCEYTPGKATTDCDRKYAYGTYIDEVLNFVDATPAAEVRYWLGQNRQYSVYSVTASDGSTTRYRHYGSGGVCFDCDAIGSTGSAIVPTHVTRGYTGQFFERHAGFSSFRKRI